MGEFRLQYIWMRYGSSAVLGNLRAGADSSDIGDGYTRGNSSTYWPSDRQVAPGCTLGCGECAVTGGTVRLIYWPQQTAQLNQSNVRSADRGGLVTASALGTTFVSPTIYISYGKVYASDSCRGIGPTFTSRIVPMQDSAELSSLWDYWPITNGAFDFAPDPQTASFNFSDFNTPIPKSLYDRLLQCVEWSASHALDVYPTPLSKVNATCPTATIPYHPIIVVPESILQELDPLWATCSADIRGQYDPPYLLTDGSVAAKPTPSDPFSTTIAATPGSAIQPPPTPTNDPSGSRGPTQTASPDPKQSNSAPLPGSSGNPNPPSSNSRSAADPHTSEDPAGSIASILASKPPPSDPPAGVSTPETSQTARSQASGGTGPISADPIDPNNPGSPDDHSDPASTVANPTSQSNIGAAILSGLGVGAPSDPPAPSESRGGGPGAVPSPSVGAGSSESSQDGAGDPVQQSGNTDPQGNTVGASYTIKVPQDSSEAAGSVITSIGGQAVANDPTVSGALVVGGTQTIRPGDSAVVGSTPISLGNGGLLVSLPPSSNTPVAPIATVGGQVISADHNGSPGAVVIGGSQTMRPGQETQIGNTPISVGPSYMVVAGSTIQDPANDPTPTSNSNHQGTEGQADSNGAPAVNSADGTNGISPHSIPEASEATFDMGGHIFTAAPGQSIVVDGKTISPGGSAAIVSGHTVSIAPSGIVIDGSTVPFSAAPEPAATPVLQTQAFFTIDGEPYTAVEADGDGQSAVLEGSSGPVATIGAGGSAAIVDGKTVSLGPSGLSILNSGGQSANNIPFVTATQGVEEVATFTDQHGSVHTAIAETVEVNTQTTAVDAVIDGSITLTAGGSADTIDGVTLSQAASGLVVNGRTNAWQTSTEGQTGAAVLQSSAGGSQQSSSGSSGEAPLASSASTNPGFSSTPGTQSSIAAKLPARGAIGVLVTVSISWLCSLIVTFWTVH
ncbi:MAG: hypothetical protein M1820_006125 [Bogoriella megaspora]|nr:MAG: hypothetical protein M1820_006125 [Bogoriella megaspora]